MEWILFISLFRIPETLHGNLRLMTDNAEHPKRVFTAFLVARDITLPFHWADGVVSYCLASNPLGSMSAP